MKFLEKIIGQYAKFICKHTVTYLIILLLITGFAINQTKNITTKSSDTKDSMPSDTPVLVAFDKISDNFGSSDSVNFVIEINPDYKGSNEIRDIRNPEVMVYLNKLTELAQHTEDVSDATSAGSLISTYNNGVIPKSERKTIQIISENSIFDSYISSNYMMALVSIKLDSDYDAFEIMKDLEQIISQIPKPAGIKVELGGSPLTEVITQNLLGADMAKTSQMSMIGIFIVLLLLFGSLFYALTPLSVIAIGIIWTMGYLGFTGSQMSSMTSGAISMIMGIGIDFGIQTVSRFRAELKRSTPAIAIETTLKNVFMPMATTTLAAVIGFKSMSLGQLTMLAELGDMMIKGVFFCFLAALTIVPVISILLERLFPSKKPKMT